MEQEYGENKKNIMNRKTTYKNDDSRYTDAPAEIEEAFARSVRIPNFLPPPKELVFKNSAASKADEDFNYTVEHNKMLTKQQINQLLDRNATNKPNSRRTLKKAVAMI